MPHRDRGTEFQAEDKSLAKQLLHDGTVVALRLPGPHRQGNPSGSPALRAADPGSSPPLWGCSKGKKSGVGTRVGFALLFTTDFWFWGGTGLKPIWSKLPSLRLGIATSPSGCLGGQTGF